MYMLSLRSGVLDRTSEEEQFPGRAAERRLVKNDGLSVIGVAGLLPGRQVPGNQGSEFCFGNGFRGIRGEKFGHGEEVFRSNVTS